MTENVQSLNDGQVAPIQNPPSNPFAGLTQEEVDKKIGNMRQQVRQQGFNEGYEEAKKFFASQSAQQQPVSQPSASTSGLTEEQIRQYAKESAQEVLKQTTGRQAWESTVNDFLGAMQPGYAKYKDFEQKVGSLNIGSELPELIGLVKGLPNAHDVMYELAENPDRAILLAEAVRGKRTSSALMAVKKLSDELKSADKIKDQVFPPDPLSKVAATSYSGDGGRSSISSLRKNPLLKR